MPKPTNLKFDRSILRCVGFWIIPSSLSVCLPEGSAMPRKISNPSQRKPASMELVAALVGELREPREIGQPIILERHMELADAVQIYVVWDRFADVPDNQRAATILQAYEQVMGKEFRNRITLATGVTVPEAGDLELLPFEVIPALRNGNAGVVDKYHQVMLTEGASILRNPDRPELRFETLDDGTAAIERLENRLPNSRWIVVQAVTHDYLQ